MTAAILTILTALIAALVAVIALYDKDRAPTEDAGGIQCRLRLNRKGLALLGLAGASAVLGVIQTVSSARGASETRDSLVQANASLAESRGCELALPVALGRARAGARRTWASRRGGKQAVARS